MGSTGGVTGVTGVTGVSVDGVGVGDVCVHAARRNSDITAIDKKDSFFIPPS